MPSPTREELIPAVKRFNRWQFIEAQNFFKELAEQIEGRDQEFLSSLADIAGGFAKIWHKGGEPHAMVSLLTKGITAVDAFTPRFLYLELESFVAAITVCLDEAKRWRRGDKEIFNRDLIPRLDFSPKSADD
jgi:hypothetical protein